VQRLTGLSLAHPVVAAGYRAPFACEPGLLPTMHARLRSEGRRAFLLSTCLRVEVLWEGEPEQTSVLLASIYGEQPIPEGAVIRTDEQAFHHLCRVAAGLESPTKGEPEVMTQLRWAIASFSGDNGAADLLERALGAAVGVGRKIRRFLGEAPEPSLATIAASLARPHQDVSILGGGAMAKATAGHLDADVTIYSRRQEHVESSDARPWELGLEGFARSPVVISTVPGHDQLYPVNEIEAALSSRTSPLLLADVGMPPGFEWLADHPAVTYVGIDEIASAVPRRSHPEIDSMVEGESTAAWSRLTSPTVVSEVIAAMVDSADRAVDEEVRRFAGKLTGATDPEVVLRQLAHTVARRVLHAPISYVGSSPRSGEAADLLGKAYGVIDD
jgi:glutamyl-tRNA reductase